MKRIYLVGLILSLCNSFYVLGKCIDYSYPQDNALNGITVRKGNASHVDDNLIVSLELWFSKKVPSNKSVILRPLVSDTLGHFIELPSIYVNGRRQQIYFEREITKENPEYIGVRRDKSAGQTIRYMKSIPFEKWMKHGSMTLQQQDCGCNLLTDNGEAWINNVSEKKPYLPCIAYRVPAVEKIKVRTEQGRAYLTFLTNEYVIRTGLMNNKSELDKINKSIDAVKQDSNVILRYIKLHGYASPEGSFENNDRLGKERVKTLKKYVLDRYHFQDSVITVQSTAEDWNGFIRMLADTTFQERDKMLAIALKSTSPDEKERKLRNQYPEIYKYILKNWFPRLRHADYEIGYEVRPFTLEESKRMYVVNPKNLSIEELFRISQTYTPGSVEYNQVFKTTVTLFPDDPVANLNAACAAIQQENINQAKIYMNKALDCPEKTLLQGVLMMEENRVEEAISLFQEAESQGLKEATDNLKQLIN